MQGQPIQFKTLKTFNDRTDYTGTRTFDPTKPIRHWIDPGVVSEQFFNGNPASPAFITQTFATGELDEPNLPGSPKFPDYIVTPTKATWAGGIPLPPQFLSFQAHAQMVAEAMRGQLVNAMDYYSKFGITFTLDSSDPRQPWMVTVNGMTDFAGPRVVQMFANGIGSPGNWVQDTTSRQWAWVSTHIPDGNDGTVHPVLGLPVIPLPAGFHLESDTSTSIPTPMIVPDMIPGPVSPPGDGFTSADRALLLKISQAPVLGIS